MRLALPISEKLKKAVLTAALAVFFLVSLGFTPDVACRLTPHFFWDGHLQRVKICFVRQKWEEFRWEGQLEALKNAEAEGWGNFGASMFTKEQLANNIRRAEAYIYYMRKKSEIYYNNYLRFENIRAKALESKRTE